MRVLLVKTSSLGDIIHTLPALTDAARAIPGIRFDWVVEEAFAEIPAWHPAVDRVIPVAIRRWRKAPLRAWTSGEWRRFTRELLANRHDLTIDAQSLLKSALLTRYAGAPVHGLDRASARERLATWFYTHRHHVARGQHAVARTRALFAHALGYPVPTDAGSYGLDRARVLADAPSAATDGRPYLVFLHGTTWATKHWPEACWRRLLETATAAGWPVRLPWGNEDELARAQRLAEGLTDVTVLPRLKLAGIAAQLAGARACVAVDTGLGHLAAALDVPTISLFGPTNPGFTGAWGPGQIHLASDFPCAPCLGKTCTYRPTEADLQHFDAEHDWPPCFTRVAPERVWERLQPLLHEAFADRPALQA
ncbi:lipopolysaccharide heptosyltransferase I [Pseudothauera rhizosphaerae]|uniref:Lipopolysaccharide heptosyltransferase 1 n=1 Tax=Pseudothauera rhizosphaerae TaxID=2565932 RepID=A0A4V3WA31_9RHOO|nr:lipopolysaccharide heptosyltransferase I [Pseudothauera rhizosphaerae]THF57665.1 lipopolysaccharide heptosyltransferase I [Pseudothauera rhizosphaerae]